MEQIRAGVITISDKGAAGEREDVSGPLLADGLREMGAVVVRQTIVPDEMDAIREVLISLADEEHVDLVLTTGGTGATPRDITPEATRTVIEREMPGLAEMLRFTGYRKTPLAVLSRGISGIRGQTIIVNLPGNPNAVRDGLEVLAAVLPHAVKMVRGRDTEHDHHA